MPYHHRSFAVESYEIQVTAGPAVMTLACRTVIRFRCHQPGATVFADIAATQVDSVIVNGRVADVVECRISRLACRSLAVRSHNVGEQQ